MFDSETPEYFHVGIWAIYQASRIARPTEEKQAMGHKHNPKPAKSREPLGIPWTCSCLDPCSKTAHCISAKFDASYLIANYCKLIRVLAATATTSGNGQVYKSYKSMIVTPFTHIHSPEMGRGTVQSHRVLVIRPLLFADEKALKSQKSVT